MANSVNNTQVSQLQPAHQDIRLPCKVSLVGLVGLAIILMIGGIVATKQLYPSLGVVSFSCLGAVPVGIALIIVSIVCTTSGNRSVGTGGETSSTTKASTHQSPEITAGNVMRRGSSNVATIGSKESRLNESGIEEELKKFRGRKDIDILVIYGNGSVQFNTDPGFVTMNPKKVILFGAWIIHESGSNRLDDALADNKEWLSRGLRIASASLPQYRTHVTQIVVSSLEEALNHTPDWRGFLQRYHVVYLVNESQ
jgi:hypothetical protein